MASQLIVPSRFAQGRPGRRRVENPFARFVRARKTPGSKVRGRPFRYRGENPIPQDLGRPVGRPVGVWMDDLCQLRKSIVLCLSCQSGFAFRSWNYYRDEVFGRVVGRCDACRDESHHAKLYIPEERLTDPGGRIRSGQCWAPR